MSSGEVGDAATAGAGLLELVFALFVGGSAKPSSLHKSMSGCISNMSKRTKMNFESKKHLQVEEQIVFFGKAA
jgi:hypothetical protein